MSRFFERQRRGELALGALVLTPGADYVEMMGHSGLDFAVIDLMITAIDWSEVANMVRAAERFDMTAFCWLQAYPWGNASYDARLPADILRATSIGCEGIFASVSNRSQVEAMVGASGNSHSRPWIRESSGIANPFPKSSDPSVAVADLLRDQEAQWQARRMVAPLIEDLEGLNNLEDMLSVPNLRGFALGMGDLTVLLGHPGEYLHPDLQAMVKRAVAIGEKRNLTPIVNVGMHIDSDSMDPLVEGVTWMWNNGVPAVLISQPMFAAQWFYRRTARMLQPALGKVRAPLT